MALGQSAVDPLNCALRRGDCCDHAAINSIFEFVWKNGVGNVGIRA